MRIGVKETQDLIRRVAADSQKEVERPTPLEANEAGMATGPRIRRRSFHRPGWLPDYVSPAAAEVEDWQKLDDDVYKFFQLRRPQFSSLAQAPSHQFVMETETQLSSVRRDYDPGTFLGLVRLAADLDETRRTLVTASEVGTFNALVRRITAGRREGEYFDPNKVQRFLQLLRAGDPLVGRGMADLLRFMARAARLPLLGNVQEAPSLCLSTFLEVVDLAARFNQASQGRLEFQVSPLDVFMAARSVLFNRSVTNPTFSMIQELVIDANGLYHDDLQEWLQSVGLFGSDLTVLLPPRLSEEGFTLGGQSVSALDLVSAGGARLGKAPSRAEWGLHTLGDALIHRVQRQDVHKDHQIQTLLQHFNALLRSERRSAARVQEDRHQARFDYMQAIRRASEAAKEAATGFFPVLKPTAGEEGGLVYEKSDAAIAPPSRNQLREWDGVLQSLRRRLTSRSPVFRAIISQLARVRSLDTALAFGLTPGGSRCLGRFMRLLQNEEARLPFPLPQDLWSHLEAALQDQTTVFLADVESLLLTFYGFRRGLEDVQFRYRDRLRPEGVFKNEDAEESLVGEGAAFDESLISLLVGVLLLELGLFPIPAGGGPPPPKPEGERLDPFLAFLAFLEVATVRGGHSAREDIEAARRLLWALPADGLAAWSRKRKRLTETGPAPRLPNLGELEIRTGWREGCERGFMEEIQTLVSDSGGDLEQKLLVRMTEIQPFLDGAYATVEKSKLRLAQERFRAVL